jgi:hypothetical protein
VCQLCEGATLGLLRGIEPTFGSGKEIAAGTLVLVLGLTHSPMNDEDHALQAMIVLCGGNTGWLYAWELKER